MRQEVTQEINTEYHSDGFRVEHFPSAPEHTTFVRRHLWLFVESLPDRLLVPR